MSISIDLSNYRALVTGVSSGIGAGIANTLALAGCDVAGCALEGESDAGPRSFLEQAHNHGRRGFYRSVDVADEAAARAVVEWGAQQLGGLDLVISNAGRNFF